MPDDLKEQIERWVADQFVDWRNQRCGAGHVFSQHGDPPNADIQYVDGTDTLHIEVTGVYYDQDAAQFENMNARGLQDAPRGWSSLKPDGRIVTVDGAFICSLNERLRQKAVKRYPHAPILVLHHIARLHDSAELRQMLESALVPEDHPFSGIYFLAELPDRQVWVHPIVDLTSHGKSYRRPSAEAFGEGKQ